MYEAELQARDKRQQTGTAEEPPRFIHSALERGKQIVQIKEIEEVVEFSLDKERGYTEIESAW